jgi:hypothetical protein
MSEKGLGRVKTPRIPANLQPWIDAHRKFQLSDEQVQMARELGMNPKKLGKLDNHNQEPWAPRQSELRGTSTASAFSILLFPRRRRSSQVFAFLQKLCGPLLGLGQFCDVRIIVCTQLSCRGAMQRWLRQYDSIRHWASGLIHGYCQPIVLRIRHYLIMARFSQVYTTVARQFVSPRDVGSCGCQLQVNGGQSGRGIDGSGPSDSNSPFGP